ncbi:glutamate 5-kinase, partial [Anaerovorax odorimutans]|nr:glutamate 5-kinase [Anaerovorax odorimutans]
INKWSRRGDMYFKQALCAIGQVEFMMAYKEYFGDYGILVGQILLTREDFLDPHWTLNIRNALFTLVDEGV